MALKTLEERVTELEKEVAELRRARGNTTEQKPWWLEHWGWAKDDPHYAEAMRLGREYRESLRPKDDESERS